MTNPDTSVDVFKRARELKASVLQNSSIMQSAPASSNERAPTSFEDTLITTLRAEGGSWSEITAQLNERRVSNDEAPTWTEAAVYARIILNNSATATPAREVGFEPRDYAHLRNAGNGREGTSKAGKKRVKDFQNATELSANIRRPASVAGANGERAVSDAAVQVKGKGKGKSKGKGKDEDRRKGEIDEVVRMDEGMVELMMRAVAKVERNFWVFVADEVEREAGKYVEPKDLEKVFHDI
ncbi:hypothetical protein C7974DRAFT_394428 [Boeremia exigua]|uniref:uncharacterized protein n=1 Tax=Boeremia exigua TaxID=749465 RepID=UPI001E8CE766|nr:uncharacterized protein C7974DRAFT_394428 [Boeremia exigua]KAH6629414.1 hypothetical protein C7974DRAFT_394428 [Boeremia exigua]